MKETKRAGLIDLLLILIILLGVSFRFVDLHWDDGALLHPDEYGFTNTLTRLSMPRSLSDYFNTRISPLSPYNKYDEGGEKISDGPDNRMRWGQLPITLIRLTTEVFGTTGYSEARLTGRVLSALADVGTLILLAATAWLLFRDRRVALLATAFSSLAVMQIQQSHFATSDNFATFFVSLTVFAGAKIAVTNCLEREVSVQGSYRITDAGWRWFSLFGVFLGMATACKINMVVVATVIFPAAFLSVAELKLASRADFWRVFWKTFGLCCLAAGCMLIAFRVFQPTSFRAATGDTHFFTFALNKDWVDSMAVSAIESSGVGGGPPSEQWAHRLPIVFPLVNMIGYGMGIPLGLMVWLGMAVATIVVVRMKPDWKKVLIPFSWALIFFLFMGTRFVKSIRYMLPIYPSLSLVGAWALIRWMRSPKKTARVLGTLLTVIVLVGTGVWAVLFVKTIYGQPHSRVEAVRWMYRRIPAMIQFESGPATKTVGEDTQTFYVSAPGALTIRPGQPFEGRLQARTGAALKTLRLANVNFGESEKTVRLHIVVRDMTGATIYDGMNEITGVGETDPVIALDGTFPVVAGGIYDVTIEASEEIVLRRNVIANESWDEGLPFPIDGMDPFGQLYNGVTNEVRWSDSEGKKEMFLEVLNRADYLVIPSQRSMWSAARIPLTYPMTLDYYKALFDGTLGFTQIGAFSRPFRLGNLYLSDLVGKISVGISPELPVVNLSLLAAEEAFSVYDHPPVWVFEKDADFTMDIVETVLNRADLTKVVVQGPRDAVWPEGYADGRLF